ncbi:MAG: hypothetical protein ACKOD2_11365, partial [Ilumatobacteraceae bacterium]
EETVLDGLPVAVAVVAVIMAVAVADTTTVAAEVLPLLGGLTEEQLRLVYKTVTVRLSSHGTPKGAHLL